MKAIPLAGQHLLIDWQGKACISQYIANLVLFLKLLISILCYTTTLFSGLSKRFSVSGTTFKWLAPYLFNQQVGTARCDPAFCFRVDYANIFSIRSYKSISFNASKIHWLAWCIFSFKLSVIKYLGNGKYLKDGISVTDGKHHTEESGFMLPNEICNFSSAWRPLSKCVHGTVQEVRKDRNHAIRGKLRPILMKY